VIGGHAMAVLSMGLLLCLLCSFDLLRFVSATRSASSYRQDPTRPNPTQREQHGRGCFAMDVGGAKWTGSFGLCHLRREEVAAHGSRAPWRPRLPHSSHRMRGALHGVPTARCIGETTADTRPTKIWETIFVMSRRMTEPSTNDRTPIPSLSPATTLALATAVWTGPGTPESKAKPTST